MWRGKGRKIAKLCLFVFSAFFSFNSNKYQKYCDTILKIAKVRLLILRPNLGFGHHLDVLEIINSSPRLILYTLVKDTCIT